MNSAIPKNPMKLLVVEDSRTQAEYLRHILENEGIIVALVDIRYLKPIDEVILHQVFARFKKIITIEDGTILGGLGSSVIEFMSDHAYHAQIVRLGIPDKFIEHGTTEQLQHVCGFDTEGIINAVKKMSKEKSDVNIFG